MSTEKNALLVAVGKRVREARNAMGVSQELLAARLDINRAHLSDIELGKREAGLLMLQIIATGLKTSMSRLLDGL